MNLILIVLLYVTDGENCHPTKDAANDDQCDENVFDGSFRMSELDELELTINIGNDTIDDVLRGPINTSSCNVETDCVFHNDEDVPLPSLSMPYPILYHLYPKSRDDGKSTFLSSFS